KDKLEAQGMFLELLFRGRKDLEKAAPVTVVVQSASRGKARATFSVVGNGTHNTLPRTRWETSKTYPWTGAQGLWNLDIITFMIGSRMSSDLCRLRSLAAIRPGGYTA